MYKYYHIFSNRTNLFLHIRHSGGGIVIELVKTEVIDGVRIEIYMTDNNPKKITRILTPADVPLELCKENLNNRSAQHCYNRAGYNHVKVIESAELKKYSNARLRWGERLADAKGWFKWQQKNLKTTLEATV